ncbi:hypothetical protein Tco_0615534 [Tanacetum coccineum]
MLKTPKSISLGETLTALDLVNNSLISLSYLSNKAVKNPSASAVAGEAIGDGMVSGIMGDEIGKGTIEGAGEIRSEPDDHSGDGSV